MKKLFRLTFGLVFALPFSVLIGITSFFVGKQRSFEFWGPIVGFIVTAIAEFVLIPKIKHADDFDLFTRRMKRNLAFIKPIYDVQVTYVDQERMVMHYANCPHCEAFALLGLPEVGPYICQGDWDIAARNAEVWDFQRNTQIGTGDKYCDHTYLRKKATGAVP